MQEHSISYINLGMKDGKSYGRQAVHGNPDELLTMTIGLMQTMANTGSEADRQRARRAFRAVTRRRLDWPGILFVAGFFAVILGVHLLAGVIV